MVRNGDATQSMGKLKQAKGVSPANSKRPHQSPPQTPGRLRLHHPKIRSSQSRLNCVWTYTRMSHPETKQGRTRAYRGVGAPAHNFARSVARGHRRASSAAFGNGLRTSVAIFLLSFYTAGLLCITSIHFRPTRCLPAASISTDATIFCSDGRLFFFALMVAHVL